MLARSPSRGCSPTRSGSSLTAHRRRARRRVHDRHAGAHRHDRARASTRSSPTSTATSTPSCARASRSTTAVRQRRSGRRSVPSRWCRPSPAVDGVAAPRDRCPASARCSTGRRAARCRPTGRPPSGSTGSTTLRAATSRRSEAQPPAAADEIVLDDAAADHGDFARRRHGARSCSAGRHPDAFTVVGDREVRRRSDSLARRHRRAASPPRPRRRSCRRPASSTGSTSPAEPGVGQQTSCVAPIARGAARRHRGHHRRRVHRGAARTPSQQAVGDLQHVPAGVRLHRPVRRLVHHLQHVLDHRGPAHPRAGLLRAIGASRRQVLGSVLVEAVVVGPRCVGARARAGRPRRHRAARPCCGVRLRAPSGAR